MKLKSIALTVAVAAAVISSVQASRGGRRGVPATMSLNGICLRDQFTDQPVCNNANTGPICTITHVGIPVQTAYDTTTGSQVGCFRALRQP